MSPSQRNVVMPLLVILLLTTSSVGGALNFPKHTIVRITNLLESNVDLTVHCKSNDNDLGEHTIRPREEYEFDFKTNIFGTTLFFCGFKWLNEFHRFDVFRAVRDDCSSCFWSIIEAGPCLYGVDGICYQWMIAAVCLWSIIEAGPCLYGVDGICYQWNKH